MGKKVLAAGIDGQTAMFEAIAARETTATVDTAPYVMGQTAMQVVLDCLSGRFKGGWVETPTTIRNASNVLEVLRKPEILAPKPSKKY